MALEWKIWTNNDNYAANGTADLERLEGNLHTLAAQLLVHFGYSVSLTPLPLSGYATIPFVDILNLVENNVNAMRVFHGLSGWQTPRVWVAGQGATADDPNRWESNGRLLEANISRGLLNTKCCGRFACGRIL